MENKEVTKDFQNRNGGFIALIIFFIIALILLKYLFNWSIFDASETPQGQETIGYAHQLFNTVWFYIKAPVLWSIHNIFEPAFGLVWGFFKDFISWSESHRS